MKTTAEYVKQFEKRHRKNFTRLCEEFEEMTDAELQGIETEVAKATAGMASAMDKFLWHSIGGAALAVRRWREQAKSGEQTTVTE